MFINLKNTEGSIPTNDYDILDYPDVRYFSEHVQLYQLL